MIRTAFSAPVALNDGCFEGHSFQLRHMQRHVAAGRREIAVIVSTAVALAGLVPLVAGCLRQLIRFLFQQFVERFLNAAADQFLELPLDYFLVKLYNLFRYGLLSPFRLLCRSSILPNTANHVSFLST